MTLLTRLLLLLFPLKFRQEYASEWLAVARAHERRYRAAGRRLAPVRAAAFLVGDAVRSAPREWLGARARRRPGAISTWSSTARAIGQDARFAVRSVKRRHAFTTIAVLTLGLGVGAATTMFSVVNGVLLQPLRYREPSQLVQVSQVFPHWQQREGLSQYWDGLGISYPQFEAWRRTQTSFEDVAIFHASDLTEMTLSGRGLARKVVVGVVSASLLPTLGVDVAVGRNFYREEEGPHSRLSNRVALVSHELWTTEFGRDSEMIGSALILDGVRFVVVGVLPEGFTFRSLNRFRRPDPIGRQDLLIPVGASGLSTERGSNVYDAVGRLRSGLGLDAAAADTQASLLEGAPVASRTLRLNRRRAEEVGELRSPLLVMLGATGLLLLIGCGNLAILSLSEANSRQREFLARQALGARRLRIARQLLFEHLLHGGLASVVGVCIAAVGIEALKAIAPPLPRLEEVGLDITVVVFAAGLGAIAGLAFGTAPALFSVHRLLAVLGLSDAGRSRAPELAFYRRLIAAEMALTAALLVPAALLVRSHLALQSVDAGFEPEKLAAIRVRVPDEKYPTAEARVGLVREVVGRLAAIPGARSATAADSLPFPGARVSTFTVEIEAEERGPRVDPDLFKVWPGYHRTVGIPLLAGRTFGAWDDADAPPVVVVDESFARQYWSTTSPVGGAVRYRDRRWTVIGVVGAVRRRTVAADPRPTLYVPMLQDLPPEMDLVVRAESTDASMLLPAMTGIVQAVDPDVPVTEQVSVLASVVSSTREERDRAWLLALFGVLATGLAAVGVFSVVTRGVTSRRHEFGVRLAMGATARGLMAGVFRTSFRTGLLGTTVGVLVALWTSRLVAGELFDIEASDPVSYAAGAVTCLGVSFFASLIPACRIAGIDAASVLRNE